MVATPSQAAPGTTVKVSVDSAGNDITLGDSLGPLISADGRYVAFTTDVHDVYVRDVVAGTTTVGDIGPSGTSVFGRGCSISADGRYLVFADFSGHLMRRDLVSATTIVVNVGPKGVAANAEAFSGLISADGRYVFFDSYATNLVAGDTNGSADVFVRDIVAGVTTRVSVDVSGAESNGSSFARGISADGHTVAFFSDATDLVPGDANGLTDVFVRDVVAGVTTRVSVDSAGGDADGSSSVGALSDDGHRVVFSSGATDLVAGDGNGQLDTFVRDLVTGVTSRVSVDTGAGDANGPSWAGDISGDGRHVAFTSEATDLVLYDRNDEDDVFVRDLVAGVTSRVNLDVGGSESEGNTIFGIGSIALDSSGSHVAFDSGAPDLVAGDSSDVDVFLRDLSPVGPSPSLSVGDVSVGEGDGGTATATFTVRLSAPALQPVTAAYTTTNGSAVAPADYLVKSGTVTIAPGKVAATIPVTVNADLVVEATETFGVTLSAPTVAVILDGAGVGTIVDDDPSPPGGGLRVGDVSVAEGDVGTATATFSVRLSAPAAAPVSVAYTTVDGTASTLAPGDFAQKSGTLTIGAGKVSATVAVTVKGDLLVEPDETFTVVLSAPVNASILDGTGQGTIVSDDG